MNNLNRLKLYTIYLLLFVCFSSCTNKENNYPRYSIHKIEYVPDSLKLSHRTWVTETIRSASQYMSGGDYEDVDKTIIQAKRTADELFQVSVLGLKKEIDDNYYNDIYIIPSELNDYESNIFDRLSNNKNK